jgi:hypothetical protein
MTDYWGARAYPASGGPNGEGTRYVMPQPFTDRFTSPEGEGNGMTIEEIRMRIVNEHPEDIAALADQWQNAYTLMSHVKQHLFDQSTVLYNEHWRHAEARDAFMKAGPGQTLAYLDEWMGAAQNNVTVLRGLVHIATKARTDIEDLMRRYEAELKDAKNLNFGEEVDAFFSWTPTWKEGEQGEVKENIDETTQRFTREAQTLAYNVGNQYFDYLGTVSRGHGTPFMPMDAVLNFIGDKPPGLSGRPGMPGGPPALATPATLPPPAPTAVAKPGDPPALNQQQVGDGPVAPPDTALGGPVAVRPPGAPLPADAGLPAGPPAMAPLPAPPPAFLKTGAPSLPPGVPDSMQGLGRSAGTAPGAPGAPGASPPRPGQLRDGVLQRNGTSLPPGTGQPPGRTLRRTTGQPPGEPGHPGTGQPGRSTTGQPSRPAPPQPGRTDQRRQPAQPSGARSPFTPVNSEEAFGRPTGSTAPPILKGQGADPYRRRPGSHEELHPTSRTGDGGAPPRPDGTAPPVLNRPNRQGGTAPSTSPARPERARPTHGSSAPGASWLGADEARADAGAPVLDAPPPALSGSKVSRLEEIPQQLRGRAATRQPATDRTARRGTVAPELTARRTGGPGPAQGSMEDEAQIITDEQAFGVRTPGGGVLTNKRDEPAYRAEPPTVLGSN